MPTSGQVTIDQSLREQSRSLISAENFERLMSNRVSQLDTVFSILSYLGGGILGLVALMRLLRYF